MKTILYYILICVLLLCGSVKSLAQDTLTIHTDEDTPFCYSLLTCTPGTDAYAHFGHTAILMEDTVSGNNVVFNYGCFDNTQKNFIINFMAGNTNYLLEAESLDFFKWRYGLTGNGVTRQQLDLRPDEAQRLWELLIDNMKHENQTYLYNWLYDNCTERARNIIEKAIEGNVVYEREEQTLTVREMLHEKLQTAQWLQLGIDMILGEEIDKPAERRIRMFLPDYFQAELDKAYIIDSDSVRRPLVSKTEIIQEATELSHEEPAPITPIMVFWCLLALTVCISVIDIIRRQVSLWYDILLLTAQGVAGIIVGGLFFFSKHPAVDSNWIVIVMNPLFLIFAILMVWNWCTGSFNDKIKWMEYANMTVLIVFVIIIPTVGQWFHPAIWPMVLTLLLRSVVRISIEKIKTNSHTT